MTIPEYVYWLVIAVLLWDDWTLRSTLRMTRMRLDQLADGEQEVA